ncbi:MAG: hypothetical protein V4660_17890 [Pseudomonadota bacterium]
MLLWLIIGCEIGFWVILFIGLFIRYILKYPKTGKAVLLCVPLLDLLLLLVTAIDLHNGAVAEFAHGLAAVYLGFTVVYGSSVIRWLDQLVAQRFASTKKMEGLQLYGWEHTVYEWRQWLKGVLAGGIASLLLFAAVVYVDHAEKTAQLYEWFGYIFWMLAIWVVCWPLWYTVFPKKQLQVITSNESDDF